MAGFEDMLTRPVDHAQGIGGPGRLFQPEHEIRKVKLPTLVGGLPDQVATEFAQRQWRGQALERQHQTGDARLTVDALRHAILPPGPQTHVEPAGQRRRQTFACDPRQCLDIQLAGAQVNLAAPVRRLQRVAGDVERQRTLAAQCRREHGVQLKPVALAVVAQREIYLRELQRRPRRAPVAPCELAVDDRDPALAK